MAMIPLAVPDLSGNESRYLQECIDTSFVSSVGPFVDRFEQMVAKSTGSTGAVATSSGTTALHLALVTVGVVPGDLVILPSLTFIASANAISHAGASPWLFDVNSESWTLDPGQLETQLALETEFIDGQLTHKSSNRRISAIMPVYTLGLSADMDRIYNIAKTYRIPIVADAAAAIGAKYRDRPIGGLNASMSVLSFNGNKTATSGSGGAIISNDESLLAHAKHLSTTARCGADYSHDQIGYNYRMSNIEAAIGCAQLERIDSLVSAKQKIDKTYREAFCTLRDIEFFPSPDWARSSNWFSGFVLGPTYSDASNFCQRLNDLNIGARPFWKPVHLQSPYVTSVIENMEVTDNLWRHIVTLPCSTGLTKEEQEIVINAVHEVSNQQ